MSRGIHSTYQSMQATLPERAFVLRIGSDNDPSNKEVAAVLDSGKSGVCFSNEIVYA